MLQHIAFSIVAISFLAMSAFIPDETVDYETATLSGVVVDAETDEPVSNAVVTLIGGEHVAVTGEDGTFVFEEVIIGDHELAVEADGYAKKSRTVQLGPEGKEVTLELKADY